MRPDQLRTRHGNEVARTATANQMNGNRQAHGWLTLATQLLQACAVGLGLFFVVGCGEQSSDPELFIEEIRSWEVPASGRFLPAPRGLYSDENDDVYMLDDAGRVVVYDKSGNILRQWYMPEYEIGKPEGVWKLRDGRVAVADTHYHRVVVFKPDGAVDFMFGSKGREPGQFNFPVAIAQDKSGYLFVGEYGDHQRIQKFKENGEFVLQFGQHGTADGEFQRPSGLALRDGEIFVVDAFNNRIQIFSETGQFLRVLKLPDNSDPLAYPYDIRVTPENLVYIIENKAARLTVMRTDGTMVGRYGHPGRGLNEFYQPWDLTVLTDGRILIADTGNHRLVELKQ